MDLKLHFYGDMDSENIVVGWGGPKGAIIEAIEMLKEEGISVGFMQVRLVHPLPAEEVQKRLTGKKRIIDVEDNYNAQLAGVITEYALVKPSHYVLKYTGRPMTVTEVYRALKNIVAGDAAERQVLTDGA